MERDFRRLLAIADTPGPDARIDAWTVRQTVAHVVAWDGEVLTGLQEVLTGDPAHYARWDEDEYNRTLLVRTDAAPWLAIRADAVAANAALCQAVRAVSGEAWRQDSGHRWPDGSTMTPASVLAYTYKGETHYAGHALELEALRPGARP